MSGGTNGLGRRARRGSSLVECAVVLAVLAIVLAAVAPSVSSSLVQVELRGAALRFGAALMRARVAALTEGRAWQVRQVGSAAFAVGPVGEVEGNESLDGRVQFGRVTSGGAVRFSPSGNAENATFTLHLAGAERHVVVNQRGKVTIE